MKKILIFRNIYAGLALLAIAMLGGCKDDNKHYDITGDATNRVFVNVGSHTVNVYNGYSFSVTHTPVSTFGDSIVASFPVNCTLNATADTKVTLEIDNSLVDSYNKDNGTEYNALPDGFAELSTSSLTIPKGSLISSDSLTVAVHSDKFAQLTAAGYLLPIRITSISNNNNAAVSVNQNTAYVIINTVLTNCYKSPVLTDMVGTLITTRTSWTGTIDVTLTSGTISRMFDGKTSTYWYVNPAKECNVTVDLSAVTTGITGLRIHSYSTNYSLTSIAVYSSSDGSNWTSQGIATLSTATVYQYIKFYLPIDARYIKLDVKGWKSAYVIMSEFDVYH